MRDSWVSSDTIGRWKLWKFVWKCLTISAEESIFEKFNKSGTILCRTFAAEVKKKTATLWSVHTLSSYTFEKIGQHAPSKINSRYVLVDCYSIFTYYEDEVTLRSCLRLALVEAILLLKAAAATAVAAVSASVATVAAVHRRAASL